MFKLRYLLCYRVGKSNLAITGNEKTCGIRRDNLLCPLGVLADLKSAIKKVRPIKTGESEQQHQESDSKYLLIFGWSIGYIR